MVNFRSQTSRALTGTVRVPSDKSISHRALLLASIAEGESVVHNLLMGEDNKATMAALQAMGITISMANSNTHCIKGVGLQGFNPSNTPLDLGNSGTGLRLLAGLLVGQSFESSLVGDSSLMQRPMQRIVVPLKKMGAHITMSSEGTPPLHISSTSELHGMTYAMPVPSAQVKSCLLLAGLYAAGRTEIIEPSPSRDHTERLLTAMGYPLERCGNRVSLYGKGCLNAQEIYIPADLSSAAFFMVAASIIQGSNILLTQVGINPTRMGVINILRMMGADICLENVTQLGNEPVADIRVHFSQLKGVNIPVDQVPLAIDELPIILIAAACAQGITTLKHAKELRIKESDRIQAMAEGLKSLGITVVVFEDGMSVEGGILNGGEVDSFDDHRIALSFAIAGAKAKEAVIIRNCDHVNTSFPDFIKLAKSIGLRLS